MYRQGHRGAPPPILIPIRLPSSLLIVTHPEVTVRPLQNMVTNCAKDWPNIWYFNTFLSSVATWCPPCLRSQCWPPSWGRDSVSSPWWLAAPVLAGWLAMDCVCVQVCNSARYQQGCNRIPSVGYTCALGFPLCLLFVGKQGYLQGLRFASLDSYGVFKIWSKTSIHK